MRTRGLSPRLRALMEFNSFLSICAVRGIRTSTVQLEERGPVHPTLRPTDGPAYVPYSLLVLTSPALPASAPSEPQPDLLIAELHLPNLQLATSFATDFLSKPLLNSHLIQQHNHSTIESESEEDWEKKTSRLFRPTFFFFFFFFPG